MAVDHNKRIVAFGFLTQNDLELLGPTFNRAWPVEDDPCFEELLKALDEIDVKREAPQPPSREVPAS
jgi:hypothetical protein